MNDHRQPTEAGLAALADGSLTPGSRERLLCEVHRSPELAAELAVQERAVQLTRSVGIKAPDSLHRHLSSLHKTHAHRRILTPRLAAGGTLAGVLGAVAVILAITLGSNAGHSPILTRISALTLSRATLAAPAESTARHTQLAVSVQGVPFPYWGGHLDWQSTGTRVDHIGSRTVTTVFYANPRGERVGYAILAGAAPSTHGGRIIWSDGVPYRLISGGGVSTITWRRAGHLCVVSGRGVSGSTLLRLASWNDHERATT
jgi:hypothetical protein